MIKITSNTKIYIYSPYVKTGGPRSLHQLAFKLQSLGLNAYIVYYTKADKNQLYEDCPVNVSLNIQDFKENIIIVPESRTGLLRKYKNVQKIIWWLSLDYYFNDLSIKKSALLTIRNKKWSLFSFCFVWLIKCLYKCIFNQWALKIEDFNDLYHLYNCEYACQFLLKNNVSEKSTKYLCGPIDDLYFAINKEDILANKTRIVTFNPAKIAPALLEKLKKAIHNKDATIELIELKNMTKEEVFSILCRTKVYVDLGFFPGPERIPREAVTLYCNVITSMEGSAANKIDVMIPDKYKFDINNLNMENLIELILDMVNNFERYTNDFDSYRLKVVIQKEIFNNNIQSIFLNKGDM